MLLESEHKLTYRCLISPYHPQFDDDIKCAEPDSKIGLQSAAELCFFFFEGKKKKIKKHNTEVEWGGVVWEDEESE